MRQIVLDTETTGLELLEGHKIIEIGCVEMINRRLTGNNYHQYINPDRAIDAGAIEVHGITNEQLNDKPRFRDVAQDFLEFVKGAELIIHNAPFDVGFLNHEFTAAHGNGVTFRIEDHCAIVDTLKLARTMHPGQKNDLDSLCRRYNVDNASRTLHGALLDAEILADVYVAMTRSQAVFFEDTAAAARTATAAVAAAAQVRRLSLERPPLPVLGPTPEELALHVAWLQEIDKKSGGKCLWTRIETTTV
jgi:DNA polymerase III subunit epsilon